MRSVSSSLRSAFFVSAFLVNTGVLDRHSESIVLCSTYFKHSQTHKETIQDTFNTLIIRMTKLVFSHSLGIWKGQSNSKRSPLEFVKQHEDGMFHTVCKS